MHFQFPLAHPQFGTLRLIGFKFGLILFALLLFRECEFLLHGFQTFEFCEITGQKLMAEF